MNKMNVLAGLLAGFSLTAANASVVFFDDFESYPVANDQSASGGGKIYNGFGVADQNTATPFGSPNQFGYLDGGSSFVRVASVSTLMTYSFDLFEPTTGQSSITRFGIGQGDVNANAYAAWSINNGVLTAINNTSLVSGSLPTLELDRAYVTYIVHNGSVASETIGGTGATLEAGQTALYFYDTVSTTVIAAGIYDHTSDKLVNSFLIRSFSADDNTLYFDNITHDNTLTVVPEPGLYAVIFACAALGFAVRRRSLKR